MPEVNVACCQCESTGLVIELLADVLAIREDAGWFRCRDCGIASTIPGLHARSAHVLRILCRH